MLSDQISFFTVFLLFRLLHFRVDSIILRQMSQFHVSVQLRLQVNSRLLNVQRTVRLCAICRLRIDFDDSSRACEHTRAYDMCRNRANKKKTNEIDLIRRCKNIHLKCNLKFELTYDAIHFQRVSHVGRCFQL